MILLIRNPSERTWILRIYEPEVIQRFPCQPEQGKVIGGAPFAVRGDVEELLEAVGRALNHVLLVASRLVEVEAPPLVLAGRDYRPVAATTQALARPTTTGRSGGMSVHGWTRGQGYPW